VYWFVEIILNNSFGLAKVPKTDKREDGPMAL
jgi:hypothetical protein